MLRVELVSVGDELLSGARVNTNAPWLGETLQTIGAEVVRGTVVPDVPADIVEVFRAAASRADAVVVTGGLGPTSDDRTVESLAELLGHGVRRDEAVAERIRSWYRSRGRPVDETTLRQADVPVGATALPNPIGSAPGLRAEIDGVPVYCLPGVPAEMKELVQRSVLPELLARSAGTDGDAPSVSVASFRTVLVGESVVARTIAPVEAAAGALGVRTAYLPSAGEVVVRFVAPSGVTDGAAVVAGLEEDAARLLGDLVAVRGGGTLAAEVARLAIAADATIAVAESLTGGSLTDALSEGPGSSAVLLGGVVAYATRSKHEVLGVDAELLRDEGPIDRRVAEQMAQGARLRFGATYGVATTGVAGPAAQDGKPPGIVHLAVAGPAGTTTSLSPVLRGDRARIRQQTVTYGLELLRRTLLDLPPPPLPPG